MKIITLHQPYAQLISLGYKQYETRSWPTKYRGALAIHAAQKPIVENDLLARVAYDSVGHLEYSYLKSLNYEYGKIVCIAEITDCLAMTEQYHPGRLDPTIDIRLISVLEKAVGDWSKGRYAWELKNIQALDVPIVYRGNQGLREVDGATASFLEGFIFGRSMSS
jgi:activating signal cointegrator 1